jgi:hypothetical protein
LINTQASPPGRKEFTKAGEYLVSALKFYRVSLAVVEANGFDFLVSV